MRHHHLTNLNAEFDIWHDAGLLLLNGILQMYAQHYQTPDCLFMNATCLRIGQQCLEESLCASSPAEARNRFS